MWGGSSFSGGPEGKGVGLAEAGASGTGRGGPRPHVATAAVGDPGLCPVLGASAPSHFIRASQGSEGAFE